MTSDNEYFRNYNISSSTKGPNVLITAGVHGDEYEPMLSAHKIADKLKGLLKAGSVTIIPIVNSSAYHNLSRYGEDGVDLARSCPGNNEGSVTEIAAHRVSEYIRRADYYIDMHTGGAVFNIFPLCGYLLHPDLDVLAKQQKMARAFNFPLIWGTEYTPNGRTLSVARDANVPAVYLEYGGGLTASRKVIDAYYDGCLNVLHHLGMIDKLNEQEDNIKYWLEDPIADSGNLQVKMPAPIAGIFVPEIELGDFIKRGDVFGTITNPLDNTVAKIMAEEDGMVFLLRSQAYVKSGDSLGGILNVNTREEVVIND